MDERETVDYLITYRPGKWLPGTLGKERVKLLREMYNNKVFIGHRIAQRRKELGMPQNHLARCLGITREMVSMIETGRAEINVGDLPLYSKILNTSPDFFIDTSDQGSSGRDQTDFERHNTKTLLHLFQRLPRTGQEAVLMIIRTLYEGLHGVENEPGD